MCALEPIPAIFRACDTGVVCTTVTETSTSGTVTTGSTFPTSTSTLVSITFPGNWQCLPWSTPGWGDCYGGGACGSVCPCATPCPCCRPESGSTTVAAPSPVSGPSSVDGGSGEDSDMWAGWYPIVVALSATVLLCILGCCAYSMFLPHYQKWRGVEQQARTSPHKAKVRQAPDRPSPTERPPTEAWTADDDLPWGPDISVDAGRRWSGVPGGVSGFEPPPEVDVTPPGTVHSSPSGGRSPSGSRPPETPPRDARPSPAGKSRSEPRGSTTSPAGAATASRQARRGGKEEPAPTTFGKQPSPNGEDAGHGTGGRERRAAAERAFASSNVFGGAPASPSGSRRKRGETQADGEGSASNGRSRKGRAASTGARARPRSADGERRRSDGGAAGGAEASRTGEGPAGEVPDLIAEVDAELARTRGKDLEWRRHNFKQLLFRWHPDKNPDRPEQSAEVFKHLQAQRARYLVSEV